MLRNIEIKAHIESIEALAPKAAALAAEGPIQMTQDDTFFRCDSGRLKLRALSATEGQLIFYRRAKQRGPKESFYVIAPATSLQSLREALSLAYGQVGRVVKKRTLYVVGRTRVHLDRVEGLGDFLELEIVLEENECIAVVVEEAQALMAKLGVEPSQLLEGAYIDLLAQQGAEFSNRNDKTLSA